MARVSLFRDYRVTQKKIFVDKNLPVDSKALSSYKTIQKAVDDAERGSVIKIAPNIYEESVVIE